MSQSFVDGDVDTRSKHAGPVTVVRRHQGEVLELPVHHDAVILAAGAGWERLFFFSLSLSTFPSMLVAQAACGTMESSERAIYKKR